MIAFTRLPAPPRARTAPSPPAAVGLVCGRAFDHLSGHLQRRAGMRRTPSADCWN